MTDADKELARQGFHRIGRIDAAGCRSLWLREEVNAIELCAGRYGRDAAVRITSEHPLYLELSNCLLTALFATEWEEEGGHGLYESYALDESPVSVHRGPK